jgi:hypothetical protein
MSVLPEPDFLIIGAMKCGTTTLHTALIQHPDVFFPRGEVKFFTIDDFVQQRQFFPFEAGAWTDHDFDRNYNDYVVWYSSLYASRKTEKFAGEDAPSYLPSDKAPLRIARHFPGIKLIVILRDPVARAWSNYWHNVNRYNSFLSFEDALRLCPEHLIDRSCYKAQIEKYLSYFRRDQFLFLLFEDLVRDFGATMHELSHFVGLPAFDFEPIHANKTPYPKNLPLALLRNYLYRDRFGQNYRGILPGMPEPNALPRWRRIQLSLLYRLAGIASTTPEMEPATRRFLSRLLRRENYGIEDVIGRDVGGVWPSFSE